MPRPTSAQGVVVLLGIVLAQAAIFPERATAQSWPQHSLWHLNPVRFNPAASANLYSLEATGALRRQWVDLPGSPTTTQVTLGAPVYIARGGVSLGLERDVIGAQRSTEIRGAFSYQILNTEEFLLSLGAGISWRNANLDSRTLRTPGGVYEGNGVDHQDPILANSTTSSAGIGADVGLELVWRETSVGIAVVNALEPRINWEGLDRVFPRSTLLYAMTVLPLAELIDLQVTGIAQTDASVWQAQLGSMLWYNRNIGFGAAFRGYSANTIDAVSGQVGWRSSNSLALAYSYDYGLSELERAHDGSHELVLRYTLDTPIGKGKLPPVIFNPRL